MTTWTDPQGWPKDDYFRCVATKLGRLLGCEFTTDAAADHAPPTTEPTPPAWWITEPGNAVFAVPAEAYRRDGDGDRWPAGVVIGWSAEADDDGNPVDATWHWGPADPDNPEALEHVASIDAGPVPDPDHITDEIANLLRGNANRYIHAVRIVADMYQPLTTRGVLAAIVGETDPDAPEPRPWLFARCIACGWEQGFGPAADPADLAEAARIHEGIDGDAWAARRDRLTSENTTQIGQTS